MKLYQGAVIKKQPSTCDHLQRQNVLFTKSAYLPLLNPGKIESVGGKVVETNTWLNACNQVYSKRHIADTYGAHEVVDPLN